MTPEPEALRIEVRPGEDVSGLLMVPAGATAVYVLAHGAGAGMTHPWLAGFADDLFERSVATLRFQFPFMERGSKRPDRPDVAQDAVRAAVDQAGRRMPDLPLVAGGRSFGGRMASQAQAIAPLGRVCGLVFLGFPLHPAKRPSAERAAHLLDVHVPMLFAQGTRDDLAAMDLLRPVCDELGPRATLALVPDADHAFHVRRQSGRTDEEVRRGIADIVATWIATHLPAARTSCARPSGR